MSDNNNRQAVDLLEFIWKQRKILIIVGVLAAIASAIVSYMIKEKFLSVVTLYPAMSSTVAFTDEVHFEQSAASFGEEEQAEQMIQILKSGEIRDKIRDKYNLMEHYRINPESPYRYTEFSMKYDENVTYQRTKYGSVKISVLDEDPKVAADVANDIAALIDSTKNRMIKERSWEAFKVAERERNELIKKIELLVDTMSSLSALGVVNADAQVGLPQALANAKDPAVKAQILKQIEATEKYGSIYNNFEQQLDWNNIRLSTKEAVYEQTKSDANSSFSHKFIVENAYPSEKKAYPVRWLVVAIGTFSSVFLAMILLLVLQKIRELNKA